MLILDSDVMIDILREYQPAIGWLKSLGDEEIALPGFVVMELLQGCDNKIEQEKVNNVLTTLEIVWTTSTTCNGALDVFSRYHLSHNIGLLDALIGQTALALDLPLYTFNRKHYAVIPDLETIAPYQRV